MKTTYIRIRLTENDKESIRNGAEKKQMSMSEYIVYLIRKEEIIEEVK